MLARLVAPLRRILWRGVEAQHRVATLRLVDTLAEHELLEQLLEHSKPPLPAPAQALPYLLATPFRYTSPHPSRFRLPHHPGVWYGAEDRHTVCAEIGYWRWRFLSDSQGLRGGSLITEHTLFQARVQGNCLDLANPPLDEERELWRDPRDYTHCHALVGPARQAGAQWLRYESARREGGHCGAVLEAACLSLYEPRRQETWLGKVSAEQVFFSRDAQGFSFDFRDWDAAEKKNGGKGMREDL